MYPQHPIHARSTEEDPMDPRQLSEELRHGDGEDLQRRRWIVGLSMVGAAMAQIVNVYQMGLVKRLPDPPGDLFDATKVDASTYAYKRFNMPDGPFMLITYGVTAALASAGGEHRARRTPWLPIAMAVKTGYDALSALLLGREEWKENKALCQYCQVATLASIASAALAIPEARRAVRQLRAA